MIDNERGRGANKEPEGVSPTADSTFRDYRGPFRPVREGEVVDEAHVGLSRSGERMVPELIYGGRRKRGPLPGGVPVDRRQVKKEIPATVYRLSLGQYRETHAQSSPRRPFAGVPILGAVADFVGDVGDRISRRPFSNRSDQADGAPRGPGRHSKRTGQR